MIPVYSFTRVRSTNTKCTRGCGCNGHPAFPTPSLGGRFINASGALRGEVVNVCLEFERLSKEARSNVPSFPDVQVHIVDAPLGAGPESILPAVVMDSGLARSLSSGRALCGPVGAPRNDGRNFILAV